MLQLNEEKSLNLETIFTGDVDENKSEPAIPLDVSVERPTDVNHVGTKQNQRHCGKMATDVSLVPKF